MSYAALLGHERFHVPKRRFGFRQSYKVVALVLGCAMAVALVPQINIDHLLFSPEERAEMATTRQMLSHIQVVRVACPGPQINLQEWNTYTDKMGWPAYLPGGTGCVQPTGDLDFGNVNVFQVACPTVTFNAADQQRWVKLADRHGWTPYPQAGAGCVDP